MNDLDSAPELLPTEEQDRLARILDDYLMAAERGEPISPEELLASHPSDAPFLRNYLSGLELIHNAMAPSPKAKWVSLTGGGPQANDVIGDFRLVREIGRGGMGVVYEAVQNSLQRRVALKILPFTAGHDAKHIGRFRNEAQAAAQVQHPNIVPVFAIGEQNGVHYYAMQLIAGQSLAALVDETRMCGGTAGGGTTAPHPMGKQGNGLSKNRSIEPSPGPSLQGRGSVPSRRGIAMTASQTHDHVRAIARLGIQAAEALHAAHEYGVVHRDVKPSNLLIDDQGKLWITDFGLARCRENRGLTQTGDVLGTMRYMSPEQALGRSALIDHRTDVFSLGVTLYELTTLHHPVGDATDLQLLLDRTRYTCKPPRHWNRHIPVDLQTILLKAIAEFPHERYATAQELAEDLRRFLDGRPIVASPPSVLSRATKWAGRHRGLMTAAAAVLIVAFAGLFGTLFLVAREKLATDRALVQANNNLRQTHAVLDRFGSQLVDQLAAIPGAEGVRYQLLEDSLQLYREFEQQAAGDPALSADVARAYSKMGGLAQRMGNNQEALSKQLAARTIWEARAAEDPESDEYTRNLALAHNNVGQSLFELGRGAEAIAELRKAEKMQRELLAAVPNWSEVSAELATTCGNLGLALRAAGDGNSARAMFREAVALQERLIAESPQSEPLLRGLAASYNNLGSLDESNSGKTAVQFYQKAIEIQRRLVKSQPINRIHQGDLARTYNNLGYLLAKRSDWKNAAVCYADAIAIQELLVKASPLAASYRRDLAISYNNLGMAQSWGEQSAKAEESFRQAIKMEQLFLAAEPNDARTLSNLGSVFNNLGLLLAAKERFAEAEAAYQQAVQYQGQAVAAAPDDEGFHNLLNNHYLNYANCLRKQDKNGAAEAVNRQRQALAANAPHPTPVN